MRILTLATATIFLALSSIAFAADVSRPGYKALVEPICKTNAKANERILKGVRNLVRRDKLKSAGARFSRASAALKKTLRQLRSIPRPAADEARLTRWLNYVKREASLFKNAGRALKAGRKAKAQRFVNKLTTNASRANVQVLAFNFRYCRFDPSKFT